MWDMIYVALTNVCKCEGSKALLTLLPAVLLACAQIGTPTQDFLSGSPLIISAYPTATTTNTNSPGAPTGKVFKYFLQIWLENADYSRVVKLSQYESVASQGILLTNYNAITHPSEPNYVAAVAGSNLGVIDDNYYDIPANITTIFDLLEAQGLTWKSYQEQIPASGWTGYSADNGAYVRKHDPAIIFDSISLNQTRSANVVSAAVFQANVAQNNMPAYSFYTPNITNDGHDTTASFAGTWLDGFLNTYIYNATFYQDALILITFDENGSTNKRNQVWGCLLGGAIPASLKGTTDNTFYTHYSALRTVELNWGLGSLGRGDANATLSNVFAFAAPALGYTNVQVTNIPLMNAAIPGLMTDCSYNYTSASGTANCAVPIVT